MSVAEPFPSLGRLGYHVHPAVVRMQHPPAIWGYHEDIGDLVNCDQSNEGIKFPWPPLPNAGGQVPVIRFGESFLDAMHGERSPRNSSWIEGDPLGIAPRGHRRFGVRRAASFLAPLSPWGRGGGGIALVSSQNPSYHKLPQYSETDIGEGCSRPGPLVDRQDRRTLARPAGILRQVEHHLATLRPLGTQGYMAEALRGLPGPGPGVVGPRLYRRACPPPCRRPASPAAARTCTRCLPSSLA
jgi:hypothetical protein